MTWIEFLIIYLACGSPFAVHRIGQIEGRFSAAHLLRLLSGSLAWPVLAVEALIHRISPRQDGRDRSLYISIAETRAAMEDIAFPARSPASILEFREVFDRYTGLALASCVEPVPLQKLFAIAGHPEPDLATKMQARRDRKKIDFHLTIARNEFSDLVTELSLIDDQMAHLASNLANLLADTHLLTSVSAAGSRRTGRRKADAATVEHVTL